ncbi:MAG: phosphoglycolate phosphatase [Gammaproteobacteria bacterium]
MHQFRVTSVLFDLDGTLVDSVPDLARSVDETMQVLGLPARGDDAVRGWVGNGVEPLIIRALANDYLATSDTRTEHALGVFGPIYARNNGRHSQLFPAVGSTLKALHELGLRLGCVTNKPRAFTLPLLTSLGIARWFDTVVSPEDAGAKKPDPAPLLFALKQLDTEPQHAIYVGDSVHDIEAANRAGVTAIGVPYGYNHGNSIASAHPDAIIETLAELLDHPLLISPPRTSPRNPNP